MWILKFLLSKWMTTVNSNDSVIGITPWNVRFHSISPSLSRSLSTFHCHSASHTTELVLFWKFSFIFTVELRHSERIEDMAKENEENQIVDSKYYESFFCWKSFCLKSNGKMTKHNKINVYDNAIQNGKYAYIYLKEYAIIFYISVDGFKYRSAIRRRQYVVTWSFTSSSAAHHSCAEKKTFSLLRPGDTALSYECRNTHRALHHGIHFICTANNRRKNQLRRKSLTELKFNICHGTFWM